MSTALITEWLQCSVYKTPWGCEEAGVCASTFLYYFMIFGGTRSSLLRAGFFQLWQCSKAPPVVVSCCGAQVLVALRSLTHVALSAIERIPQALDHQEALSKYFKEMKALTGQQQAQCREPWVQR